MVFVILGIIIMVLGIVISSMDSRRDKLANIFRIAGIVMIVLGIVLSAVRIVEPGTTAVQTLFGRVMDTQLESGLHIINPFVELTTFNVKTQNYTMSGIHDEGTKEGDDAIRVLSADGLEVVIDLTVLYRVIPSETPKILKSIGVDYENNIIRPIARTKIRDNAVYYDAVSLYSKKRDEFQTKIYTSIEKEFKERGLFLENLLVRNITLPLSVKATIESKINAEQEAQKMQFVLQKEQQEAERKRIEAQGLADYQRILNSELSDKLLQYERIKAYKELALSPNAKVIIMPDGGKTPFIIDAK
jgi:regulator of protease activity HflC (stomatin/prohibitin superfamily)